MVSLLRRFSQPLMVFFTVFIIIAFAGWGPNLNSKSGHSGPITVIRGKPVNIEEWQREGRIMQIHARLGGGYAQILDPSSFMGKISPAGVENSLLFEGEAAALGVTATVEEIQRQLTMTPAFTGRDGKFDNNRFEAVAQQVLMPEGFAKTQVDQFLSAEVRALKIASLLASTMPPTPFEVKFAFIRSRLTTEASYVELKAADFLAAQTATEDEIKKHYEARKDLLKSPEKRKVRFAAFMLPPAPADGKPPEDAKKTEELQNLANAAYDFVTALQKPGVNFDEAAKAAGATIGETAEYFPQDAGPKELEGSPAVAAAAFDLTKEKPYSRHIPLDKGTCVLALKDTKAPEQLPFDQVRKQLQEEIIAQKADAAMTAKAIEIRAKLVEARKAAKSFEEAAKPLGVKANAFPPFSMMMRLPPGTPHADIIRATADKLAPGEISQVIPTEKASLIVHVDQRPAVDEKGMEEASARIAEELQMNRQMVAFQAWLMDRREAAGLKPPGETR